MERERRSQSVRARGGWGGRRGRAAGGARRRGGGAHAAPLRLGLRGSRWSRAAQRGRPPGTSCGGRSGPSASAEQQPAEPAAAMGQNDLMGTAEDFADQVRPAAPRPRPRRRLPPRPARPGLPAAQRPGPDPRGRGRRPRAARRPPRRWAGRTPGEPRPARRGALGLLPAPSPPRTLPRPGGGRAASAGRPRPKACAAGASREERPVRSGRRRGQPGEPARRCRRRAGVRGPGCAGGGRVSWPVPNGGASPAPPARPVEPLPRELVWNRGGGGCSHSKYLLPGRGFVFRDPG